MNDNCESSSVRRPQSQCKQCGPRVWRTASCAFLFLTWSGCTALRSAPRAVTLGELRATTPCAVQPTRHNVADGAALQSLAVTLGPRLGLVTVSNPEQWAAYAELVPDHGPMPDFAAGMLVAIASWAGASINDEWPIRLGAVRLVDGGGLISAHFVSGTYFPDGTACLEAAYVPGLRTVLAVEVDDNVFYPD